LEKKKKLKSMAEQNNLMMQFQSDLFGSNVIDQNARKTAWRCLLAGLAVGYWKSVDDLQQWSIDREFTPDAKRRSR
jgi:glycerol kinase